MPRKRSAATPGTLPASRRAAATGGARHGVGPRVHVPRVVG
jgi:hypothetical protein